MGKLPAFIVSANVLFISFTIEMEFETPKLEESL
jgi:hypothetical protein